LYVDGKDFTLTLLEQGHARLRNRPAKELPEYESYKKAEDAAKKDSRGLWATFDFEGELERKTKDLADLQAIQSEKESFPIAVTDVRSGSQFSFQILNSETNSLNELSVSLQSEMKNKPPYTPDRNEIVAARFTTDEQWYRAQIIGDNRPKGSKDVEATQFEVKYIDYGNREWVDKDRIRHLPEFYRDSMKPQAFDGQLLWIKAPDVTSEFGRDSAEGFRDLVWGKTLIAQEAYKDRIPTKDKKEAQYLYHLVLIDEEKTNINEELIFRGYVRTVKPKDRDRRHENEGMYSAFLKAENEARSDRLNIWQYGDYPDSEEERDVERSLMR